MKGGGTAFRVGLVIVVALGLVVGFVAALGSFSLSPGYTLYADYNFSGSVREGAPVKVSGIKVGKVRKVKFMGGTMDESVGRRVQVRMELWVENKVRDAIRKDAQFYINTAGVLGEQYIEIVPGNDYASPPLAPKTITRGVDPARTDLLISRLYDVADSFAELLDRDEQLIQDLLRNSASAIGEIDTLLREHRDDIGELIGSASELAGEASVTLNRVNEGLKDPEVIARTLRSADRLLRTADSSLRELTPPVHAFVKDATRVTGLMSEERLDKAVKVAEQAVQLTGKASKLIDNVDGAVTDIRRGKGTAGALIARDELYTDLRELIRDLRRNPWKLFWKE